MTQPNPASERPERRWLTRIAHLIFRFTRPMTLGVRAIVIDPQRRIFLVRHTYVPGWHLPGGGVDADESLEQAITKELREEGNIEMSAEPRLFGMYFNRHVSRRDHVALFVVESFRQTAERLPDREIAECGFFPLDDLPATTTKGTRARLREALEGHPRMQDW